MNSDIKLRYLGYSKTPSLFLEKSPIGIDILEIAHSYESIDSEDFKCNNSRLGKLVEEFVFYDLKLQPQVKWISENLQIQDNKTTIGELDALYHFNHQPVHLEVVYKFYLYDTLNNYNNDLEYWIGPNRKDTLIYKLNKLEQKQFPLLYNSKTKFSLDEEELNTQSIRQKLCFKAQLFLPFNNFEVDIKLLNKDCVTGFYISIEKIEALKNHQFFLPNKLDWLVTPHNNVEWLNFETAKHQIKAFTENKRSPMCWVKHHTAPLKKCFITYW